MKKYVLLFISVLAAALSVGALNAYATFIPFQGGTGTTCIPSYGQVLVGTSGGIYNCQATSTLGITGGSGSGTVTTLTAGTNITFSSGSTCTVTCTINSSGTGTNFWSTISGGIYNNQGGTAESPTIMATSTTATSTIVNALAIATTTPFSKSAKLQVDGGVYFKENQTNVLGINTTSNAGCTDCSFIVHSPNTTYQTNPGDVAGFRLDGSGFAKLSLVSDAAPTDQGKYQIYDATDGSLNWGMLNDAENDQNVFLNITRNGNTATGVNWNTQAFTVSGGISSFDGGAVATDGAGDVTEQGSLQLISGVNGTPFLSVGDGANENASGFGIGNWMESPNSADDVFSNVVPKASVFALSTKDSSGTTGIEPWGAVIALIPNTANDQLITSIIGTQFGESGDPIALGEDRTGDLVTRGYGAMVGTVDWNSGIDALFQMVGGASLQGKLYDDSGSAGTSGQVLTSTGSNIAWANATGGSSFAYPFTPSTNYASTNQATTGIAWFQNGLNASSTSHFVNASSTVLSAKTICLTTCISSFTTGTVTSVATNNGLTGGTITTTGTLGLDVSKLSTNALVAWNGTQLAATGTPTTYAGNFVSTTTTASQFPYASSTAFTAQNYYVGTGTGIPNGLIFNGNTNPFIDSDASQQMSLWNSTSQQTGITLNTTGVQFRGSAVVSGAGSYTTNSSMFGSAGSPAFKVAANADGFFDDVSAGHLAFANAGVNVAEFSGANFGIGTTTPFTMLAVAGTITANNINATSTATSTFSGPVRVSTTSATALTVTDAYGTNALTVSTASSTGPQLLVQATSSTATLFSIDQYGHTHIGGLKPSVSCVSTCILSADSHDAGGSISLSGIQTSLTLTFSSAWNDVACWVEDSSTAGVYNLTATTTISATFTTSVSLGTVTVWFGCNDLQ